MATIEDQGVLALISGELTHKKLTTLGKEWLLNKRCNPVFVERGANLSEIPDVIGWASDDCFVIECKMSLADFRADKNKPHRQIYGLGSQRYYLIPQILKEKIVKDEYFLKSGWGLIVASSFGEGDAYNARQVNGRSSEKFKRTPIKEISYLRSRIMEIQRYGQ